MLFDRDKRRSSALTRLLVAGFGALVLNSAYLATSVSPTLFFYGNVALHVALGAVAALGFILFVALRRPALDVGLKASSVLLLACAAVGVWLAAVGATRAHERALDAHAGLAALGVLILAAWLERGGATRVSRFARGASTAGMALLLLAVVVPVVVKTFAKNQWQARFRIVNPLAPPASMEGEGAGPSSPFFPSSANTTVNGVMPGNFFLTSQTCGRCHQDIYEQWNSSAHHFSSFNNQWYGKLVEHMQDVVGTRPSKWCAGCHDHAVFFNGRFDRPIREQIETPEAQAGLGCASCHSIVHVNSSMGQGDFTIERPPLHDLAASENRWLRGMHDTLVNLAPEPHRNIFIKPFHREEAAEFCSVCHKAHLDVPVNGYRWLRAQNDYDNWQASGVSGQGARSFYSPPAPRGCNDCHMPLVASNDPAAKNGKVRSHRFPGANTALPFVNRDPVQLKVVQDFLRDGQISVDIFGITRVAEAASGVSSPRAPATEPSAASTFAVGEESAQFGAASFRSALPPAEVIAPLDKVSAVVRRGESVRVEVVVRTRKVGHVFPGGTVDMFDVWVELEAVDDKGQLLLHSGFVADGGKGPVDSGAHFYRSRLLDAHGNPINKHNVWAIRSVAYVRLIPPGAADTVHYRLQVPEHAGNRIVLRAKVNYRKFAWWNTQWAFAGVRDPAEPSPPVAPSYDDGRWIFTGDTSKVSGQIKAIPDLPTTIMAQAEATLAVVGRTAPLPPVAPRLDRTVRERWNDYGIGLLLQGDLKSAEAAFLKVTAMDPLYADGPVNVARALIQEGDVAAAIPMLERALAIAPRLAKAHFFLAMGLKTLGRYEEALAHLRVAAAQYPRDRVVLGQIGRILFLERRFEEAIAAFQQVLRVDPEDLPAHYNLMLCYQGAGNRPLAERERRLYDRFKADESAQAITGPYRLNSPDDNNERQQVHEHRQGPAPGRPDTVQAAALAVSHH